MNENNKENLHNGSDINDDEDEDEDEFYVVVKISDFDGTNLLSSRDKYSISHLNTGTPYLQIDENVFQGKYEDNIGTDLIFEHDDHGEDDGKQPILKYKCLSTKKLNF